MYIQTVKILLDPESRANFTKYGAEIELLLEEFTVERTASMLCDIAMHFKYNLQVSTMDINLKQAMLDTAILLVLEKKIEAIDKRPLNKNPLFIRYSKILKWAKTVKTFDRMCRAIVMDKIETLTEKQQGYLAMLSDKGMDELKTIASLLLTGAKAQTLFARTEHAINYLMRVLMNAAVKAGKARYTPQGIEGITKDSLRFDTTSVIPDNLANRNSDQYHAINVMANTEYSFDLDHVEMLKGLIVDKSLVIGRKERKQLVQETGPVVKAVTDTPLYLTYKHCDRLRIYSKNYGIGSTTHEIGRSLVHGDRIEGTDLTHYYCAIGEYLGLKAESFQAMVELVTSLDYLVTWKNDVRGHANAIIEKADKPFMLMAALLEWDKVHAGNTNLLVPVDASCSGVGIIAALTRRRNLLAEVNLTAGNGKRDLYMSIANKVALALKKGYKYETTGAKAADRLKAFPGVKKLYLKWHRSYKSQVRGISKKVVMLLGYGGTDYGIKDGIAGVIDESTGELSAFMVAQVIGEVFINVCKADADLAVLFDFIDLLEECGRALSEKQGKLVTWKAGDTWVTCAPLMRIKTKVDGAVGNGVGGAAIRYNVAAVAIDMIGTVDPTRVESCMSPLFVHALDALVLSKAINKCAAEGIKVLTVHDSIYANPFQMPRVLELIQDAYSELFVGTNLLQDFVDYVNAECGTQIGNTLVSRKNLAVDTFKGAEHIWS